MITFTVGNIFDSSAQALVNTVNCEGYMGKGLAYQFKLKYPKTNLDYVKACKSGKLYIGEIHYYKEDGKYIINFPTKDKWRADSKMEYIKKGLEKLKEVIHYLKITSIAIPPLGSGNGRLNWQEVKELIVNSLSEISDIVEIIIYEPSKNYKVIPVSEPKLNTSALVLMQIKSRLRKFNDTRLQKTAYLVNIFSHSQYFKFKKHKYGPYDNAIKIISKDIAAFQDYHGTKDTSEAYQILYNKIVSASVKEKLSLLEPHINAATQYINNIKRDRDVEGIATTLYIIENECGGADENTIIKQFKNWSEDKANRFPEDLIKRYIHYLYDTNIIGKSVLGYFIL